MTKINHRMIQLARESRGLTQSELAEKMKIPQGNLSRMERGDYIGFKDEHLDKFSTILNYPKEFFYQTNQIATSDTHYRKAIVLDQRTKLKAEAIMNIYKFHIEEMLTSLDLGNKNIPILREQHDSPQKIAKYLRSYWKVPKGTIDNLTKVIEDNGIIVIQLDFETDKIDGRTIVSDTGHPIIFLNKTASGDRQRTTLAHELGHVILHMSTIPTFGRDEETEAFDFGAEFLMPLAECEYDLSGNLTLERLADLKRVWKIAMQAILYRAQKQELITYNKARYLWSQFTTKGWRKREPIDIPRETPTLFTRMVDVLMTELEYTKKDLAKVFKLNAPEIDDRFFSNKTKLRVA
jgi:Zn-dependent peptidase ImmA (M78 family)/transcriptional regulator with XRE-family HTH domain